jgi:hypothetical protein
MVGEMDAGEGARAQVVRAMCWEVLEPESLRGR